MCHFASLVLTKDHAYFGTTDSHEDIIKEHKLYEGAGRVNILRVEIVPPEDDASAPLETWTYHVDQGEMPKWYDAENDEKRARAALGASKIAPLNADYRANLAPLYADYEAKFAPLYADYRAELDSLDADYRARDPLDADYRAKIVPLYADYQAKRDLLDADYDAKIAPLGADYQAKRAAIAARPW